MDTMTIAGGLAAYGIVAGGVGFISGVLRGVRRWGPLLAEAADAIAGLKADKTRLYGLFDEIADTHALDLMAADNRAKKQDDLIRKQGIEIAEFRAKEHRRLAPLKAQAAKNHAAKLAREAAQKALHASMQADVDAATAILDRKDIAA